MSKGRTFCQKVKKQRVRSLSPRGPVIYEGGGGGGMAGANGGGGSLHLMQLRMGRLPKI